MISVWSQNWASIIMVLLCLNYYSFIYFAFHFVVSVNSDYAFWVSIGKYPKVGESWGKWCTSSLYLCSCKEDGICSVIV